MEYRNFKYLSKRCRGFKEIIFLVNGKNVFSKLKFESGVHRVQRVPDTETSGRVHTSAATVAILAEAEDVDIQIDPKDLRYILTLVLGHLLDHLVSLPAIFITSPTMTQLIK